MESLNSWCHEALTTLSITTLGIAMWHSAYIFAYYTLLFGVPVCCKKVYCAECQNQTYSSNFVMLSVVVPSWELLFIL
jgi:hypothetical protein